MINWKHIDTVLLDMDGTLLDLNFDNYFWLEYLPEQYAKTNGLDEEVARELIFEKYRAVEGTLKWYSTTYWSETLDIDVVALSSSAAVPPRNSSMLATPSPSRSR